MSFQPASSLLRSNSKNLGSFRHGKDITPTTFKPLLKRADKLEPPIIEELDATQEIPMDAQKIDAEKSEEKSEDAEEVVVEEEKEDSEDDEDCFREHCKELLKEYGLATVQAWFDIEKRRFQQKQKTKILKGAPVEQVKKQRIK